MENSKEELQEMNMELISMISDLSRELGRLEACYEMLDESHKELEEVIVGSIGSGTIKTSLN